MEKNIITIPGWQVAISTERLINFCETCIPYPYVEQSIEMLLENIQISYENQYPDSILFQYGHVTTIENQTPGYPAGTVVDQVSVTFFDSVTKAELHLFVYYQKENGYIRISNVAAKLLHVTQEWNIY